jgi:hypothetical protein
MKKRKRKRKGWLWWRNLAVCVPEAERSKQHINPKLVAGSLPCETVRVQFLLAMACQAAEDQESDREGKIATWILGTLIVLDQCGKLRHQNWRGVHTVNGSKMF